MNCTGDWEISSVSGRLPNNLGESTKVSTALETDVFDPQVQDLHIIHKSSLVHDTCNTVYLQLNTRGTYNHYS